MDTQTASTCLEALGQATRLEVFRLLVKAGEPGLPFGEVQALTGVPASTLSHHLATLARAGLVKQSKRGRSNFSTANFDTMHGVVAFLTAECCSMAFDERTPAALACAPDS